MHLRNGLLLCSGVVLPVVEWSDCDEDGLSLFLSGGARESMGGSGGADGLCGGAGTGGALESTGSGRLSAAFDILVGKLKSKI